MTGRFHIQSVTPANVHGVPELLYRGFGYTYVDSWMYEPARILEASRSGDYHFFIAVDAGNEARAIVALRFGYPNRAVGELGTLLTDPAIRGIETGQVLRQLLDAVGQRARQLTEDAGLQVLVSTEVTVHQLTQRLVELLGFVTTGIYLGWTPIWAELQRAHQMDAPPARSGERPSQGAFDQRRAETVSMLPFWPLIAAYRVSLPDRFGSLLRDIYARSRLPVEFVAPAAVRPRSVVESGVILPRSVARVELREVGADAPAVLRERAKHYRHGLVDLIHVLLPLSKGDIRPALDALLADGFQYAALVPQYRDCDVLVLQYLNRVRHSLTEDQLCSDLARRAFREMTSVDADASGALIVSNEAKDP